jgi:hypothetical protein
VVLRELVLSREEHSAMLLEQEDPIHWGKARLPSTQTLLTISGTMGTTCYELGGKEQEGLPWVGPLGLNTRARWPIIKMV